MHTIHRLTTALSALVLFAVTLSSHPSEDYQPGPDSKPQDGVPKGEEIHYTFENSKIFPGTTRQVWIYVPKQYDGVTPACLHVNQDGKQFLATTVFDNLIAKKEMPVTIGVFVTPGVLKAADPEKALDRFNRCVEYDGLSDAYVRFLLDELLPDIETHKTTDGRAIKLSKNGNDRAIAGSSSGAICAFTAAWHRPDAFQRVFTCVGTFVDQRGGNVYPALVRKMEAKPIRIFLQDGSHDGNGAGGSWFLANQEMLMALEFAGYEANHMWGDGGHDGKHATAIFPDAVRWLWKDWPKPVAKGVNSKQITARILIPGEEWQVVSEGHGFTEGPAANAAGEVFFTDIPKDRIHKIGLDGKVTVFAENTNHANGLAFGPDGKLYACQDGKRRIVAYDRDAKETVIAEDVNSNDIVVNNAGGIYFTDPPKKQIWYIPPGGEKRVVDKTDKDGPTFPNGIRLTPDQSLLVVADTRGQFCWSYRIEKDGALSNKQYFHYLHIPDGITDSAADGMTFDDAGRMYVATRMGIQLCDQAGRHNGIISKPQDKWLANVVFGGKDFDELYACCSDKVYKRKTKVKGLRSYEAPFKTKPPAL
jgi:sugar lactone lactonase YvrE/enterochelin esterase-like enzyme